MPHRRRRSGVLLAGGGSTRFGGAPKGLAALGDQRLSDWPLQVLDSTCDEVLVAANDPAAASWFPTHRVVRDAEPGRGALGALETALAHAAYDTVVVCAWDMPFVTPEIVMALVDAVEEGASCCVPMHDDGTLEALCAVYHRRCGGLATELLRRGERAAHALMSEAAGIPWSVAQHLGLEAARRCFGNINTAEDLRDANRWLSELTPPPPPESRL